MGKSKTVKPKKKNTSFLYKEIPLPKKSKVFKVLFLVIVFLYFVDIYTKNKALTLQLKEANKTIQSITQEANNINGKNRLLAQQLENTKKELKGYTDKDLNDYTTNSQGWYELENSEIGIKFIFPPFTKGDIQFKYSDIQNEPGLDPNGAIYSWEVIGHESGQNYPFATGQSEDYAAGREHWYIDVFGWTLENGTYIVSGRGPDYQVNPTTVISHSSGSTAIVYPV